MSYYLGIDPGKSGALAFIDPQRALIEIFDMPVQSLGPNSKRSEVAGDAVGRMVRGRQTEEAFIEDVWSMTNDGHVGAFSFGDAYGTVKGVLGALDIPFTRVRPQVWKKTMRVTADKNLSRQRAMELIPAAAAFFARVKDDGRAEAALIALYGVFQSGVRLTAPLKVFNAEVSV